MMPVDWRMQSPSGVYKATASSATSLTCGEALIMRVVSLPAIADERSLECNSSSFIGSLSESGRSFSP